MSQMYADFIKDYPVYANDKLIEKAFDIAEKAHEGQKRKSGEPYIIHPVSVARILADLKLDGVSICAAMLNDVPEDTNFTIENVKSEFGEQVALIVDGVTKLKKFDFQSREEAQAESMRKMFLAMASDIRVVIIKLADRLHNMRTLNYQTEEKQKEKSRETLEIYAPLANRLGINAFKWEFEDLALKYLEPEAYRDIALMLNSTRKERTEYIEKVIKEIKEQVTPLGIPFEIDGRPKHIYSIYKKMKTKNKSFDELYDLVAVRIIVETVKDCYAILGAVHTAWKPIPMRFKDYIAVPKQNMYQSLHTTLLGADGKPFEVQIRTKEMHMTAEYGIAAHWKYKEGISGPTGMDNNINWLHELMEWQNDVKDSKEFVEALKINFFSDNVFVFTPKGDVKDFVKGSTPLDFAYSVHSQIGNRCIGAKVNGKLVPLNYELKTGDIVEIITSSSNKGPSRDWLNMVKTAQARNKIRAWFKKEFKEENIHKGKEMLEREAKREGYNLFDLTKPEWLKPIFKRFTLNSLDDMYAAVGYGGLTTGQVLLRLVQSYNREHKIEEKLLSKEQKKQSHNGGVIVKGYDDMTVRFAKCCNPLPGDAIIGYITRGRGVSIHRADCSNITALNFDKDREIEVEWAGHQDISFNVEIKVEGVDRQGLIVEISQLIYNMGFSLTNLNARSTKNGKFVFNIMLEVNDIQDLELLIEKIKQIRSVETVFRMNN